MNMLRTSISSAFRPAVSSPRCLIPSATVSRSMASFATRHENDPEILERGKQSVLDKHKKDSTEAPRWHEEIASDSEAFVKATRSEIKSAEEDIKAMTKESEQILNKSRKEEPETGGLTGKTASEK